MTRRPDSSPSRALRPAGTAAREALAGFAAPVGARLALVSAWSAAVGAAAARRCAADSLEKGAVMVRVPDAGWSTELLRHEPEIVAHLAERGLTVSRLSIRIDPTLAIAAPEGSGGRGESPDDRAPAHGATRLERAREAYLAAATRRRR